MESVIIAVLVGSLLGGSALAADKILQDQRDVLAVDAAACKAFKSGNAAALKGYLDPHFTLTNSSGKVTGLEENLVEVAAREPRYEVFRDHDQTVRLYGDAAIITGITSIKGTAQGMPFEADFKFTDTYVRHDGHWLLAASHASKMAK